MNWYRVRVSQHGVKDVEEVSRREEDGSRVYYVQASSKTEVAQRGKDAYNAYCREKVRARREQLANANRCTCGRERNIAGRKKCSVCIERARNFRKRHPGKRARTGQPRDEGARVAANLVRQRDRQNEIRLETLLEARARFSALSEREFARWLDQQIDKASAPKTTEAA